MSRTRTTRWIGVLVAAPLLLIAGPLGADATGWYVELRHGPTSLDANLGSGLLQGRFVNDEADASSAEVGYRLNKYLGLQAGYHDLGTYQGRSAGPACPQDARDCPLILESFPFEADFSGWSLAAVPAWPWNDRFALYGKLGALAWEGDLDNFAPAPLRLWVSERYSGTDLLTAVGARYRFAGGFGVLVEHQQLDLDLESTSLGVSWKF